MSSENYKWYPPYKEDPSFSPNLQGYRDRITKLAWFQCSIVARWVTYYLDVRGCLHWSWWLTITIRAVVCLNTTK